MDNLETLITLRTQDTGRRQTKQTTQHGVAHLFCFLRFVVFLFVCLRPVSCVSNVSGVSGFVIHDYPNRFSLTFILISNEK